MKTKLAVALTCLTIALAAMVPAANAARPAPAEPVALKPRLFAVPVLEPGKQAWVSVYDQFGHPVPQAALTINGVALNADAIGQASFVVPQTENLKLSVNDADGKAATGQEYTLSPGGYLVAEKQALEAVDRIEESVVSNEQAPTIAYAPSAVEISQPFVLIGKNLSGKADGDHLLIDGYDADTFSGSSVCLLATTPRRMSLGPLREMYLTTGDETSNTVEVDVCHVEASVVPSENSNGLRARIRAIGTNVPSLVEFRNLSSSIADLSFESHQLGKRTALITSGGENNSAYLDVVRKGEGEIDIDTHLVADAPWSPDDRTTYGDQNKRRIIAELNKAEIVRLKRRLIAIETRLAEEQEHRTKALSEGGMTPADLDKINAQLRTLSNRQRRINAMVVARRAVYQALGGDEAGYRQALDDAAGGGAIALEKYLAPLTSVALLASTSHVSTHAQASANEIIAGAFQVDRAKEMQQLAELTRLWKKMPTKIGHSTRLAPPPPAYMPNLKVIGEEVTYEYHKYVKGAPPPPPPLVSLMKQQRAKSHVRAHHGGRSTKASRAAKYSQPRSKSRRR